MNVNDSQIRERLERRQGELLRRFERISRDLPHAALPISADFAEQAVEVENDETLEAIAAAAQDETGQIDIALERRLPTVWPTDRSTALAGRPSCTDLLGMLPLSNVDSR